MKISWKKFIWSLKIDHFNDKAVFYDKKNLMTKLSFRKIV